MNTEQFFRKILPAAGLKILAELVPVAGKNAGWRYVAYESIEAMAEAAVQIDARGRTVYHACNGFGPWHPHPTRPGKQQIRDQGNVVACRSLYDDIDVGKADSYATRQEAGAALKLFINATKLPLPTIVYSGGGLHLYWSFDEDITPADWQRLATKKRLVARHFGLKVDAACDLDSARVLRPVGTTWRKAEDREVTCKYEGETSSLAAIEDALDVYIYANNIESPVARGTLPDFMLGDVGNLAGLVPEYPPAYMDLVADACAQMNEFRTTGGTSEPAWHAAAGIAKHCVDGDEKYHQWSMMHEGYDEGETQSKLYNWGAGPTTCAKFKSVNPNGCAGCKRSCSSPVALGSKMDEPAPTEAIITVDTPEGAVKKTFVLPDMFPSNFAYNPVKERITGKKQGPDGVTVVDVATPLFYVVDSICQEDGTSALVLERVIRGRTARFEIPTKYTADKRSLAAQLAAYRIISLDDQMLSTYIKSFNESLQKHKDEVNTYSQLGWHHDGDAFLIGSKLITKDGSHMVRVGTTINDDLKLIGTKKGSVDAWVSGVDELYNRPNAEPYQLAVCLAFGGIFGTLIPSAQWKGIPFALTSDRSGLGKSTACKIGLNIYCQADSTMVADSTAKGMIVRTGAMGNLPFLMDEVTKYVVEAKDMSDLLYALSNGKSRIGSTGEGVERKNTQKWNVPVLMTGNRNILHHVTEHTLNAEAVQMRVFEIDLETYPILETLEKGSPAYNAVGAKHKALTDTLLNDHYGVIGEEWLTWVINNQAAVREKLSTVGEKLRTAMCGGDASKERYYYDLASIMLVGGYFAKKLGYINFDLNNLKTWIVAHIAKMRNVTEENKHTPEDLFGHMMADMNGRLLVTNRFDGADRRATTTVEMDQANVRGVVDGRVVMGSDTERARVYISTRAVTQWCTKNGVQYSKFKRDLMALQLLRLGTPGCNKTSGTVRVRIGKGVVAHEHLGQVNCLEFDAKAAKKHLMSPVASITQEEAVAA